MRGRARRIYPILMLALAMAGGCSRPDGGETALSAAEIEAMRAAAEAGDPEAQFQWAELHEKGDDVKQDDAVAATWYRKAAEQGHVSAQFHMGEHSAEGRGTPRSDEEAIKWYRLAAQKGDVTAQFNLGSMLRAEGERQDFGEALRWFRAAAHHGDSDAQHALGVMYELGEGVPQDYAEAMKMYRLSADQENLDGIYGVASLYESGLGVEQDVGKAIVLYREAADDPFTPHADAQNAVAWIYATCEEEGYRDARKAARYALKASAQDPKDPYYKDTLAAAYARNGWFEDAVAAEEMAIELAKASDELDGEELGETLADFESRLSLYRKGEAYVDAGS